MQRDELINSKITLPGGKLLPHSLSLKFWTHDFTDITDFLVRKDDYDEDCLRLYKSLEGFCSFIDRHVEDLKYHGLTDDRPKLEMP